MDGFFNFNTKKFDFWPIYEAIKKYFPLGIEPDHDLYESYPGKKVLTDLLIESVHQADSSFSKSWANLEQMIGRMTNKPVTGTTYGQQFCYSAYVEIERVSVGNLTEIKRLCFFKSLLGAFYTILGVSENCVVVGQGDNRKVFLSNNYIVPSPSNEFAGEFHLVEQLFGAHYKGYRFVPFWILKQRIQGLHLFHQDNNNTPNVFNALFNDHLNLSDAKVSGDEGYKIEEWIRSDYDASQEGSWSIYPPLSAYKASDNE